MKSDFQLKVRVKAAVRGAVQGVGFRPFVHRLATELALTGWVNNSPQGVFIEVEGARPVLEEFLRRLGAEKPPRSFIQSLETTWLDAAGFERFEIRASATGGGKSALVLPDMATCPDCLRELFDPRNRRFRYPFTNCTNCGPRFSIIEALPYDRANTSMKIFTMCPACQAEYDDPNDRRFHAQPNACPVCGPKLEFWRRQDRGHEVLAENHDALLAAAEAIRGGKIIAAKGLGGFHLLVDARNEDAVRQLRERKHREEKPFALMFPSLASAQEVCEVAPLEERLLYTPEAPIVLLRKIAKRKTQIVNSVAPGNPNLGVMLPANPLHHLLMAELGFPVVATSGNLSDEPLCTDELEALERLGGIADFFLVHNRPIVRHMDDSIVRVVLEREMILRRARGYAPLPISISVAAEVRRLKSEYQSEAADEREGRARAGVSLAIDDGAHGVTRPTHDGFGRVPKTHAAPFRCSDSPHVGGYGTVLGVGAHLKNTVALAVGGNVFISQHIGDLETEAANDAFRRVAADLPRLYDSPPDIIAADLHPDYLSTKFALERRSPARPEIECADAQRAGPEAGAPQIIQVQHHIAHVLACLAENEVQLPALGVSWDGTGYGTDGTIWGGEFFVVTDDSVERVAHLRPFRLPGGDAAVKEPRRAALGLLHELGKKASDTAVAPAFFRSELTVLETMLARGVNAPWCSSIGRLFDAVAAIANLRQKMRFEGQAAMELEFALDGVVTDERYPMSFVKRHGPLVVDWSPMIEAILWDAQNHVAIGEISAKFHNALAESIVEVARRLEQSRVALSGGCFQNRYLTERTVSRLRVEKFQPYWHQRVPANDGGISLGQVVAALRAKRNINHQP